MSLEHRLLSRHPSQPTLSLSRMYLRLTDFCITQLKAQGPSRTCDESKEEEEKQCGARVCSVLAPDERAPSSSVRVKLVFSLNKFRRRWTLNWYWMPCAKTNHVEHRFSRTCLAINSFQLHFCTRFTARNVCHGEPSSPQAALGVSREQSRPTPPTPRRLP